MNNPEPRANRDESGSLPPAHRPAQDYLFRFWDELADEQRSRLADHVARIDVDQIQALHAASETVDAGAEIAERAAPPTTLIPAGIQRESPEEFQRATAAGWQALRGGRVGIVLVAGGEGSRLGFPHPKGQFPIGPVSRKSLYQLLAEQAVAISRRAGAAIPYYVMTSDATHAETVAFFKEHHFFGLDPATVRFFRQGKMPAVDQKTGEILLAAKDCVALSPDGHGGLLEAMQTAKVFDDIRERQIESLFYHQVDNPLVRVCDPAFLGFHLLHRADVSTKVVGKDDPDEKVGLLVEVEGQHHMIEYTDLPKTLADQRSADGRLRLRCGNIAVHIFRCDFLERMAHENNSLPYHRSSKAVAYINSAGELVEPTKSNAFKFERFIFDILPRAERPLAMEVIRDDEFVPLKNREGTYSPDFVRQALRRFHTSWLKRAGWTLEDELPVEIPAAVALDAEEFIAGHCEKNAGLVRKDSPA